MINPFSDAVMAEGYAAARPPVHPRVLSMLGSWMRGHHHDVALDLGCGAGLSTRPLREWATRCVGFDPAEAMVRTARRLLPDIHFLAAAAERMPFADGSVDLIAAAGSLNYTADLAAVWQDVRRVLARHGTLAVYDFSPARTLVDSADLDAWFAAFTARYPYPANQAIPLSPAILAERATGFTTRRAEEFALPLELTPAFYVEYMLTETNVQHAVRRGTPLEDIRAWCSTTVPAAFGQRPRQVLFRGYLSTLAPTA